jgi:hypothetical protein
LFKIFITTIIIIIIIICCCFLERQKVITTISIRADNVASDFLHSDLLNTLFCDLYRVFFVTKMKILEQIPVEGDHFVCGGRENRMKLGSILGK